MLPTDLNPNAAEHAPIRGDLARLYIEHKHALALDDWTDAHQAPNWLGFTEPSERLSRSTQDDCLCRLLR